MTLGDVTTINLTMLKAGVQYNVVPAEAEAGACCQELASVMCAAATV
jgi:hypothetical protein